MYIHVEQTPSDSALYRSLNLTVHKEQYVLCFNSELWPEEVGVQRYIPPRRYREFD